MTREPIRVGIVGVGWGSVVITPAFRVVDGFEVKAICSRRPERVAAAAEKLDIAETSTDWEEFVRRDDLDLIVVATPTSLHHEQTMAVLAAGKHVLCEKPVALDASLGREMYEAAEAAGKAHAVCFEGRYLDERRTFAELVRGGAIGDPYFTRFTSLADYWHPSRGLQSEWMYDEKEGGGYLLGMASHDIDMACAVFGDPVAVCADVRTSEKVRQREDGSNLEVTADDTSVVLMRMASGATVEVATCAVAVGQDQRRIESFGRGGAIMAQSRVQATEHGTLQVTTAGEPAAHDVAYSERDLRSGRELPKRRAAGSIKSLALLLEDWLPAIKGEGPATGVPTLRDGYIAQSVVDAARRSSRGEGWVELDPPK
jgi:predicted dehydrogenase